MLENVSGEQIARIEKAIFEGRKIEAINIYRQATGKELKDSKEDIEKYTAELERTYPSKFVRKPKNTGCSPALLFWLVAIAAIIYFVVRK